MNYPDNCEDKKWWLWFAIHRTKKGESLLYACLLENEDVLLQCIEHDAGELDVLDGKVVYCSRNVERGAAYRFLREANETNRLRFSLLDSLLNHDFLAPSSRQIIGKAFGKSVVPVVSYYTFPDLTFWKDSRDDLARVLNMLSEELNLPFSGDYARKFGNFEFHDMSTAVDTAFSIGIINNRSGESDGGCIRIAKSLRYLNEKQTIHVVCRQKKDVIYNKLIPLVAGEEIKIVDELPEDAFELECWVFDENGRLIYQEHCNYIASVGLNMSITGRKVILKDRLTESAGRVNKELGNKASAVNSVRTDRSLIRPNHVEYEDFNDQMIQIQSDLFGTQGHDQWFGRSIECEIEVIKHLQSLVERGRAKKVIVVDPFFGAEALERFVARIEEFGLELVILTSLSDINPDTGARFSKGSEPIGMLRDAVQNVKGIINCELRLINVNRGASKQAFHDRYLVVYPFDGLPAVYMLSNSINKMSGNWPFCISKLDAAVARKVREYIENLCNGVDNSRDGDPKITYQWPENG